MIELSVYNRSGQEVEKMSVDESVLGGAVRYALLKQAVVMYHANKRVGTAATKSRGMIAGSGKKLYRQKGTGNARVGNSRTVIRAGGGVAFAKTARDFGKSMPRKQRRLARDSAILAKLRKDQVVVVDELPFDQPRTKDFVGVLKNLKIDRSCLVALKDYDENVYKSARNVQKVAVLPVAELNAGDICLRQRVLFTKAALEAFLNRGASQEN